MMLKPRVVERERPREHTLPGELHAVTQRVLTARGITDGQALDTSLKGLAPADKLGAIDAAAELIEAVMVSNERILVIGDFDADGATSTAVALRALSAMGAPNVAYLVPNRFEYGYGLTPEIVALAATQSPALIITVDNGISSVEGVASAQQNGIRVLITDHHLPGRVLPQADAIVNPNLPGDRFASKCLAGVGVIFYVMTAVRARLRNSGWFDKSGLAEPNLAELLDLVALGTVADVVPLDHNNRRLVAQGLARIRAGRCQPGITALIDASGRSRARITASDLAFALGPRLNAAGRMSDMSVGIECLITEDTHRCAAIADELNQLNRERRAVEGTMRDQAFASIEKTILPKAGDALPVAFCIFQDDWHQGVVGIVASRIKDHFHRPAIAFAPVDDATIKGSARSIPGLHIRDTLDAVATANPGLLTRFGGHAMAAGLSLERDAFDQFQSAFIAEVASRLEDDALDRVIATDGELKSDEFSMDLARELAMVIPWGQGIPEPRFAGHFRIEDRRIVGGSHARLVLKPASGGDTVAAIAFGAAGETWYADAKDIAAVYKLDINDYRGIESLQLVIDYAEMI